MFDLSNKTALITGATGGIGSAIVELFHNCGANIVATGTSQEKLEDMKNKFNNERISTIKCNLRNRDETKNLISEAFQVKNSLDILVCNAGITRDNLAIKIKDEDWDDVIEVNLSSVFILNRDASRIMMKKKWGRIINITSVVAFTGNYGQANYSAAKGGMVSLTKTMALEFSGRGITVNCIAPGFIDTDMTKDLNDTQKEIAISHIPMKMMGDSKDIAYGALYLASNEAKYVTGHSLHINGGMFMS